MTVNSATKIKWWNALVQRVPRGMHPMLFDFSIRDENKVVGGAGAASAEAGMYPELFDCSLRDEKKVVESASAAGVEGNAPGVV